MGSSAGSWPLLAAQPPLPQHAKPTASELLLSVNHARQKFGGLVAVNDVSFGWKAGKVVGLIGPNGTGKSTTFHLVTGVLQPMCGEITLSWTAHRSARFAQYRQVRHRPYISAHEIRPTMTVLENVASGVHLRGTIGVYRSIICIESARV
jgi:branched-chain amino acid transport system permease protein